MRDLEIATEELKNSSHSLIVAKNGRIIMRKNEGGIKPLFDAVLELGDEMNHSSVADRVIGKAAAALCISGGITGVYTPVMSRAAVRLLAENGIVHSTDLMVPGIMNRDKTDLCPLEKLTSGADSWEEVLDIVREFAKRTI
jgi:hypothetical protein